MHMAFLSRVFKNLQWYGMTFGKPHQTAKNGLVVRFFRILCVVPSPSFLPFTLY